MIPGFDEPAPANASAIPHTTVTAIGQARVRTSARALVFRQAMSGPMPISRRSGSPNARRKKS